MSKQVPYFPEYKHHKICLKFSTCDLYCGCAKSGRCRYVYVLRLRVPACVHGVDEWLVGRDVAAIQLLFKLKVVEFAEKNSNRSAEREFDVNEKQIRDACAN